MKRSSFTNTDEYIESFPEEVKVILQNLRSLIKKNIPKDSIESISYQIPAFKLNGKYIIYFAAFKNHISLYPIPPGTKSFRSKIDPFVKGKGTISFDINKPLPSTLVENIIENAVKASLERTRTK